MSIYVSSIVYIVMKRGIIEKIVNKSVQLSIYGGDGEDVIHSKKSQAFSVN